MKSDGHHSATASGQKPWCIEVFDTKPAAVTRANEITTHLDATYRIRERWIRVEGERKLVFVLVVRQRIKPITPTCSSCKRALAELPGEGCTAWMSHGRT